MLRVLSEDLAEMSFTIDQEVVEALAPAYDDGIRDAIGKVTDDWAIRFPGIADVEHVYFYAATSATPDLVQEYFRQAYQLGRDFERPTAAAEQSAPAA